MCMCVRVCTHAYTYTYIYETTRSGNQETNYQKNTDVDRNCWHVA